MMITYLKMLFIICLFVSILTWLPARKKWKIYIDQFYPLKNYHIK